MHDLNFCFVPLLVSLFFAIAPHLNPLPLGERGRVRGYENFLLKFFINVYSVCGLGD